MLLVFNELPWGYLGAMRRGLPRVVAFHEPRGVVVSRVRQGGAPTLFTLLPEEFRGFFAVGRLDKDSEGLILLCDDSRVAQHLMDPGVLPKTYVVTVRGLPSEAALDRLRAGGWSWMGEKPDRRQSAGWGRPPGAGPGWRWCSRRASIGKFAAAFTV